MPVSSCETGCAVDRRDFAEEGAFLKALADPTRLTIVSTLAKATDEVCVCDFTDALPMNQSSVSHHLKILRDAGIVTAVRRGTWVYYSLAPGVRRHAQAILKVVFAEKIAA